MPGAAAISPTYTTSPRPAMSHLGHLASSQRAIPPGGTHLIEPQQRLEGNMDGFTLLNKYGEWLTSGFAPTTVMNYRRAVVRFFTETGRPPADVREEHVADWLNAFPWRSAARSLYYQALVSFFGWALRHGHVTHNPLEHIPRPKRHDKQPRALSEVELEKVLAAAFARRPDRGYALAFLYYSAARLDEFCSIAWEDVQDDGIVLRKTKNGNERLIPWSDGLRRALDGLRDWYGDQPHICAKRKSTVWRWCKDAGEDAGVENVHPHLLRATAATRSLVNGARPHAVSALLGHAKITTSMRYWAVERVDLQDAVDRL